MLSLSSQINPKGVLQYFETLLIESRLKMPPNQAPIIPENAIVIRNKGTAVLIDIVRFDTLPNFSGLYNSDSPSSD